MSIEAVPKKHAPAPDAPTPLGEPPQPSTDTLIFRVSKTALSLVGGSGRGAGWMGIVDLPLDGEPTAARVVASSRPARIELEGFVDPRRVPVKVLDLRAALKPRGWPVEVRVLATNVLNYIYDLVPETLAPVRTVTLTAVWTH